MDNYSSSRNKDYPSLSYQKSPRSNTKSGRISLGGFNENLVGGEKKRHIKNYKEHQAEDRINGDNDDYTRRRNQSRRYKQDDDDDYDEDFRRMSIGSPVPNNHVNPDGSPRKQAKGHYPSIKVDQVKEADGRSRRRLNNRHEEEHQEGDDYDDDDERIPMSPASPLPSPRARNGRQADSKPRRIPPPSSPRLLRSRSPNNLSPRSPSPSPRVAAGKEFIAYYEEDVDLKPKSISPRDKKHDRIPSLGKSGGESQLSYKKRPSPRDRDGDDFDWNDYASPRSNHSNQDDDEDDRSHGSRQKTSPREYQGRGGGGGRRHEGRGSVESPPLSPLSSSGGSSFRSPRESPRSPDDVRSSWESSRSDKDFSPRDEMRSNHVPPISRRKKQGKLEPIEYR